MVRVCCKLKALLSAWYECARILATHMRSLCVATHVSQLLGLLASSYVSLFKHTRSTGHTEKSEGRMSAGAGRGDGRRWLASAASDSCDGSSGGARGIGSVMARESVGLFLDGVVPVEVLLKDLQNAVTDSVLAWQKGQSKSGQTGRHAQVVRARARTRIHVVPEAFIDVGPLDVGVIDLDAGLRLLCWLVENAQTAPLDSRLELVALRHANGTVIGARRMVNENA